MVLTKLEAVNIMLDAIGEAPVSSLVSGLPEAAKAERFLDIERKAMLAIGWEANTYRDYTAVRDVNNRIPMPGNALRIDTVGRYRYLSVTLKDLNGTLHLYDLEKFTFTFEQDVVVDITWNLEFEEIGSYALRHYIAWEAASKFQQSVLGSIAMDSFVKKNRDQAWIQLLDEDAETKDLNILYDSNMMAYMNGRRNSLSTRGR